MQQSDELELSTGTLDERGAAGSSSKAGGNMDTRKLCAYNQTRECFLGLEVDGADLSLAKLKDRIASLALKSGEGLWLAPFRGLPEWGIRVPLDLLYLDQDCRVIDVVESYPVFRANASTPQPASVLALAHSLDLFVANPARRSVGFVRRRRDAAAAGAVNGSEPQRPTAPMPRVPWADTGSRAPKVSSSLPARCRSGGDAQAGRGNRCAECRSAERTAAMEWWSRAAGTGEPLRGSGGSEDPPDAPDGPGAAGDEGCPPSAQLAGALVVSGPQKGAAGVSARPGCLLLDGRTAGSPSDQGSQLDGTVRRH